MTHIQNLLHVFCVRINSVKDKMRARVVVDVDAGTDDAVALLLLLTLEAEKNYKIIGITCTHGNTTTENVCRNVLKTLEVIHRRDVPVYRGAEGPLISLEDSNGLENFHGKDGFGDVNLPPPEGKINPENAIQALDRISRENDGITLICLGPLTNIALAIRSYPNFVKSLKEVYIMGGNFKGIGNTTSAAEFNFYKDPEAAHIVLSSLKCPVTVVPWEACYGHEFSLAERFQHIGSILSPQIKLLNKIETGVYKELQVWLPCDGLLAGVFIDSKIIKTSKKVHLSVELHGKYTRGQAVIDHLGHKQPNVLIVEEVKLELFKELVLKMAKHTPAL